MVVDPLQTIILNPPGGKRESGSLIASEVEAVSDCKRVLAFFMSRVVALLAKKFVRWKLPSVTTYQICHDDVPEASRWHKMTIAGWLYHRGRSRWKSCQQEHARAHHVFVTCDPVNHLRVVWRSQHSL